MAVADGEGVLGPRPTEAAPSRLSAAFGRRLSVLEESLGAALEHDEAALHRSRVASRRLREILPLLAAAESRSDARRVRKARKSIRSLTIALGGVRELDVGLGIVEELEHDHSDLADAAEAVRRLIERDRAERRVEMADEAVRLDPEKLLSQLARLRPVASEPGQPARARAVLATRLRSRAERLASQIQASGALYAFDRLHRVRIAAKKLRYGLELAHEVTGVGAKRLVARVKSLQDLLGRLHDLEIVAGYVRVIAGGPRQRASAPASRLLAIIDAETRSLHATYLQRAASDLELAQSAVAALIPRVLSARRSTPREGKAEEP